MQQRQQQQDQQEVIEPHSRSLGAKKPAKKSTRSRKRAAANPQQPSKKVKENVGETIEEEELDESGFNSTLGESIYEDFDNQSF